LESSLFIEIVRLGLSFRDFKSDPQTPPSNVKTPVAFDPPSFHFSPAFSNWAAGILKFSPHSLRPPSLAPGLNFIVPRNGQERLYAH